MKTYKARGIILHTVKYGEKSLVVYMLTDVLGRQSYLAYKRSALLQPMFLVEFEGSSSPRAELHRFGEMTAGVPLRSIPFDVRKSTIALFMAEVVYRLVREQEPAPELFEFVWGAVEKLDGCERGQKVAETDAILEIEAGAGRRAREEEIAFANFNIAKEARSERSGDGLARKSHRSEHTQYLANFHLWFLVGLAKHLGFAPSGEWTRGGRFDVREGIFTPVRPAHGVHFSVENSELLWRLMREDPGEIALNRVRRAEFLNAMLDFLGYHLDAVKDIRSVEILREVF